MTKLINYLINGESRSHLILLNLFILRYENVIIKLGTYCKSCYCTLLYHTKCYKTNLFCLGSFWTYIWPNNPDEAEIPRVNMPQNVPDVPDAPDGSIDLVLIFSLVVIAGFVGYGIYKFMSPSPISDIVQETKPMADIVKQAKPTWEALREKLADKFLEEHPGYFTKEMLLKHLDLLKEMMEIEKYHKHISLNVNFETYWKAVVENSILYDCKQYMADMLYNETVCHAYRSFRNPPVKPFLHWPSSLEMQDFFLHHPLIVLFTLLVFLFIGVFIYANYFERNEKWQRYTIY